jgi:hypothetical protein
MISRNRVLVLTFSLLVILLFNIQTGVTVRAQSQQAPGRSDTIPIKVVLVGFDPSQIIPSDLVAATSGTILPSSFPAVEFDSGNNTGVVYRPIYNFTLASPNFKSNFENYLNSSAQTKTGNDTWFIQYAQDPQNPEYTVQNPQAIKYVVYDANSVENWLWDHSSDFGGTASNGWTIIISYLPDLPSVSYQDVHDFLLSNGHSMLSTTPHYYGLSVTDKDLGYQLRYRDFMNAWGGQHRMWFVDLSAGPVYNSQWEDLPLQVALGDNKIDLTTDFAHHWLTDYIGDYVAQATYNFIGQSFVYYPQYAKNYQIDVYIMDDRNQSDIAAIPIQKTVNRDLIQAAFNDLVPYSHVTVNVNFPTVTPELDGLLKSNYKYTDSFMNGFVFAAPQRYGVINVKPAYNYMLSHITQFEPRPFFSGDTMTVPVFAFAFSGQTYFTDTYKWAIGSAIDWENDALLGEALPGLVMISYNQWEFTRGNYVLPQQPGKGEGFTETIIHETGHEFGLMHPHQYGPIGDFIASPMGYFTDDYSFGQIDKDSIQRAHIDQLYMKAQQLLTQTPSNSSDLATQVNAELAHADAAETQMNYTSAIQYVLAALQLIQPSGTWAQIVSPSIALTTVQFSVQPSQPTTVNYLPYIIAALVVGIVIGGMVAVILGRKKSSVTLVEQ